MTGMIYRTFTSILRSQNNGSKMDIFYHSKYMGHSVCHMELQKPHITCHWWTYQNRDPKMNQYKNYVSLPQRYDRAPSDRTVSLSDQHQHDSLTAGFPTALMARWHLNHMNIIQTKTRQKGISGIRPNHSRTNFQRPPYTIHKWIWIDLPTKNIHGPRPTPDYIYGKIG